MCNTQKKARWSSSDKKIATVKAGVITARSVGKCTIMAKIGKKKYKCLITVTDYDDPVVADAQKQEYNMLARLNIDRAKCCVPLLKMKKKLVEAAKIRVKELEVNLAHIRPDGSLYDTVYKQIGINSWAHIGENIAFAEDTVGNRISLNKIGYNSLFKSDSHRKIMMDPNYKYVGIGFYAAELYEDSRGVKRQKVYWTQDFYK